MTFFDENELYWGDKIAPLIGKGDERLSARSVKIFADGASALFGEVVCDVQLLGIILDN
jgi:hypothetical protein